MATGWDVGDFSLGADNEPTVPRAAAFAWPSACGRGDRNQRQVLESCKLNSNYSYIVCTGIDCVSMCPIGLDVALHGERAYPASAYEDGWPEHLDFHEVHEVSKHQNPHERNRHPALVSRHPLFGDSKQEDNSAALPGAAPISATGPGAGVAAALGSAGLGLVTVSGLVREHEILLARTVPVLLSRVTSLKRVPSAPGELDGTEAVGKHCISSSTAAKTNSTRISKNGPPREHHDSYTFSTSSSSSSSSCQTTSTSSGSSTLRKQLGLSLAEYARAVLHSRVEKREKTPTLVEHGPDPDNFTRL